MTPAEVGIEVTLWHRRQRVLFIYKYMNSSNCNNNDVVDSLDNTFYLLLAAPSALSFVPLKQNGN